MAVADGMGESSAMMVGSRLCPRPGLKVDRPG